MKNKKRRDGSGLMIFLCAAIAVVAIAFIAVGVFYFSEEDKIPVQTSASSETAPAVVSVTASGKTGPDVTEKTGKATGTQAENPATSENTTEMTVSVAETTEPVLTSESSDTKAESKGPETTSDSEKTTDAPAGTSEAPAQTTAASELKYDLSYFSNDLFIGDSIYTGLYLYEYFPESQVFAKLGMNPQSARTVSVNGYTAVQKIAEMKPLRVFIMLGTNGLAYMSASLMADEMKAFAGELKAASPESVIYIVSIPPVTYAHELKGKETMAMVNKYNKLLESAAAESGTGFLDLCTQLKNEDGYFSSKYAEADGMHFLGSAYKHMLGFFYKSTQ